ncbi:MAG: ARMT1-like domain-containing protein [Mangrovibacterium sp.]|nr:ARMT1-like domain-containing protein [Mangrovibacterium sp.]
MTEKLDLPVKKKEQLTSEMFGLFNTGKNGFSVPALSRDLHALFKKYSGDTDPYKLIKRQSNDQALNMYSSLKKMTTDAENPFDTALRLAIAGNIIDYGISDNFDLVDTIEKVLNTDFAIDHAAELKQAVSKAKTVLYLGDNAGEIVFDKLLIETLMHPNIWFAVRGAPVINDVTIEDARDIHMDDVADIIENGYDAPSTILEHCSKEFKELYAETDIIISKGQGNLEGLIEQTDKRIFFLLMVKCDVIADVLGVKKGSFVVVENKRKR